MLLLDSEIVMRNLLRFLILSLIAATGAAPLLPAQAAETALQLRVTIPETLTLSVPSDQSFSLANPTQLGKETIASEQAITVKSNCFSNMPRAAYITLYQDNAQTPDYEITLESGEVTTTGNVTAQAVHSVACSNIPTSLVYADTAQKNTFGAITYTFNLCINKKNIISEGVYTHHFVVTATNHGV